MQRAFLCKSGVAAGVALVAVATFAFRWLSLETFHNDHFEHVARAQQVLLGAWPVRDFVDPGLPLTYLISAGAQVLLGNPFLAEALLFVSGFAAAAAISFRIAHAASGSAAIAVTVVLLQVAAYPRSYNYPKLLVYAMAIAAGWWAIDRLNVRRVAVLGITTAVAYYFRHDHGVYVAIGTVALIAAHRWRRGVRSILQPLTLYAVVTLACLAPHLAYVEWHSGLRAYFDAGRSYSRAELGANPMGLPWFALQLVPGNSVPFLYWLYWLLPAASALLLLGRRSPSPLRRHVPKVVMVVALALMVNAGFLRAPLTARLPDVAVPHTILGAWLLATLWRRPGRPAMRLALRAALVAGIVLVGSASAAAFETAEHLRQTGVWRGARAMAERWVTVTRELRDGPPGFMPSKSRPLLPFLEYVRRCTSTRDRLLYVGYQPEVYVVAGRGFAGGQIIYAGRFNSTPPQQALTVRRLATERVPFVLLPAAMRTHFRDVFREVWNYVDTRYVPLTTLDVDGDRVDILVDESRQTHGSVYAPTGWPCFN